VAFGAPALESQFTELQTIGRIIGVSVSATFLFIIGFINLVVLINVMRTWRKVVNGGNYNQDAIEDFLAQRGFMNRCCGPALRAIIQSWHMYPLGFLFGLGFDTATEVALLGLSATTAGQGVPAPLVLLLPLLFAAGMSLIDTADGMLMIRCYGWAFVHPVRKLYYNMTVTLISVFIAFAIGLLEVFEILQSSLDLKGPFWDFIAEAGNTSTLMGVSIVVIFVLSLILSTVYYKCMRYDELSFNTTTTPETTTTTPGAMEATETTETTTAANAEDCGKSPPETIPDIEQSYGAIRRESRRPVMD